MSKLTTDDFVNRSKFCHDNYYNYLLTEYKSIFLKVKITCPIHGIFEQTPHDHLKGHGCKKCGITRGIQKRILTISEFIQKAENIHDKYDYSHVDYYNSRTKVKITCPIHGIFEQTPHEHLNGHGCPECGVLKNTYGQRLTTLDFIEKAKFIHGDKYNYSLVNYISTHIKVKIICPIHSVFEQQPNGHLNGYGCRECYKSLSISKPEKEVFEYVKTLTIEDVINNDRTQIINPKTGHYLELDIWIPSLNKAIEFNGRYWHSLEGVDYRDHQKNIQCKDKGIELLVIEEQDWLNDKYLCEAVIKLFITASHNQRGQ
jgi:hypothetical protein